MSKTLNELIEAVQDVEDDALVYRAYCAPRGETNPHRRESYGEVGYDGFIAGARSQAALAEALKEALRQRGYWAERARDLGHEHYEGDVAEDDGAIRLILTKAVGE